MSYTRDMHCYCIQVNDSVNGDSRITAPKDTNHKDLLKNKGDIVITETINIKELREFQSKPLLEQYDLKLKGIGNNYKMTHPNYDYKRVQNRINNLPPKDFK